MLDEGIRLSFETSECMVLKKGNIDVNIIQNLHQKKVSFILHKFIQVRLVTRSKYELVWAPFELIICKLSFKMNKVKIN